MSHSPSRARVGETLCWVLPARARFPVREK